MVDLPMDWGLIVGGDSCWGHDVRQGNQECEFEVRKLRMKNLQVKMFNLQATIRHLGQHGREPE